MQAAYALVFATTPRSSSPPRLVIRCGPATLDPALANRPLIGWAARDGGAAESRRSCSLTELSRSWPSGARGRAARGERFDKPRDRPRLTYRGVDVRRACRC